VREGWQGKQRWWMSCRLAEVVRLLDLLDHVPTFQCRYHGVDCQLVTSTRHIAGCQNLS